MDNMSILVIQIIIKQWDKSERSAQHVEQRAKLADRYPIIFPAASYLFNQQCVVDLHGDDLQGNRIHWSQPDDDTILIDRFKIRISDKTLSYIEPTLPKFERPFTSLGSVDNKWLQCKYDWRYNVDYGGFYFWLYEEIIVNAIHVDSFDEKLFMGLHSEELIELA